MTTRTDWRKTCAELIENVRYLIDCVDRDCFDPVALMECREHLSQTRTALSQPEPEVAGPITDGRPMNQSYWLALLRHDAYAASFQSVGQYRSALIERASSPRAQPEPEGPTERIASIATAVRECAFGWEPTARLIGNVCAEDVADLCGAILTRYARPAIEPVPVAERLPGPEDCAPWPGEPDATHWAWAGKCVDGGWEWSQLSMLGLESNTLGRIIAGGGWTYWARWDALPVPGAEAG